MSCKYTYETSDCSVTCTVLYCEVLFHAVAFPSLSETFNQPLHYGRLGVVGILDHCNLISAN